VTIEKLSVSFRAGIGLEIEKLAVYPGKESMKKPVITLDEAETVLKFAPLLQRKFEWAAIRLVHPKFHLVRDKQGKIGIEGFRREVKKTDITSSAPKPSAAAAALPVLVDSIRIDQGEIRISDRSGTPMDFTARDISAGVENLSLLQPSQFRVRFAFLSDSPNLSLSGTSHLPAPGRDGFLKDVEMDLDLGTVKMAELIRTFPALSEMGLKEGFTGKLSVRVPDVVLSREGVREWKANLNLTDGSLVFSELKGRLQGIILKAALDPRRLTLQSLYLTVAGGQANISGAVGYSAQPVTSEFSADLRGLVLDELLPAPSRPEAVSLEGVLSLSLQGGARGTSWPLISQSLGGQGTLDLAEGRAKNLNVLRGVFQKISVIPGLLEKLESRLPESYAEKLTARDTVFEPINLPFVVQGGAVFFKELHVVADSFELHGSGRLGLDGSLACQADLVIDPNLSLALIKTVNELEYLLIDGKRIAIPITIRGKPDELRILPDLRYIAKRVAVVKTTEVVTGLVQKALEKKGLIQKQQ